MNLQRNYTPKELSAFLSERGVKLSEQTIWKRCRLWERQPSHVLAIPYLRHLGRPMRIPATAVEAMLRAEVSA